MTLFVAEGFESSLLESWSGWDDLDLCVIQFYDPVFKGEFSVWNGKVGSVVFDLNHTKVEAYSVDSGEIVFSRKFSITLEEDDAED